MDSIKKTGRSFLVFLLALTLIVVPMVPLMASATEIEDGAVEAPVSSDEVDDVSGDDEPGDGELDDDELEGVMMTLGEIVLLGEGDDDPTAWYGDGTAEIFSIGTAEELAYLAELVRAESPVTFAGKVINLTADIDLSTIENWTPIGQFSMASPTITKPFSGTFDGGGFAISNMTITNISEAHGLFGNLGAGAVVKNLALINVNINANYMTGGMAAYGVAGALVSNCYVTGSIVNTNTDASVGTTGGIVANRTSVENCWSHVNITAAARAGGIASNAAADSKLTNCYALGTITVTGNATYNIGGIVAQAPANVVITSCVALQESLTTGAATATRIGGNSSNYSKVFAFDLMKLTGSAGRIKVTTNSNTDSTGYGLSKDNLGNANVWGILVGFPAENWVTASSKLPILKVFEDGSSTVAKQSGSIPNYILNAVALPSDECNVESVQTPAGATVSGGTISATVSSDTASQIIGLTVSENATWELFSDEDCTNSIDSKTVTLVKGANLAYVLVTAEDGTTKTYTISIMRPVECEVVSVLSPADAELADGKITAIVAKNVASQIIDVTVSENATWALYSNAACTLEIENKTMTLAEGANTAYIKVTGESSITTKIFTVSVERKLASFEGNGTESSPYLLSSIDDLNEMGALIRSTTTTNAYRDKHYKLTQDIDMTGVEDFQPLSGATNPTAFMGTFDGNGKTISNLRIVSSTGGLGLFANVNESTIKNIALTNLYINSTATGGGNGGIAGSVVGYYGPAYFSNCYVSGTIISGGLSVGGIVGSVSTTITVEDCRVDGSVSGMYNVGGIMGQYNGAPPIVKNCVITASLESHNLDTNTSNPYGRVGGIVGNRMNASGEAIVENCMVLSESISSRGGYRDVGAIWGDRSSGTGTLTITDSYAWKGLKLNGTALKEILYGQPLFSNEKNGATTLSWKLKTADGWPAGLKSGAWTYAAGKIPVMTAFADKMSAELPAYMADYLTAPGTANPAALGAVVTEAEVLQLVQYPDGWADFSITLARAKIVLNDTESSQAELDAATTSLTNAIQTLKGLNSSNLEGTGTDSNPYLIKSIEDLQKMSRLVGSSDVSVRDEFRDKHYKLTADLDMTGESWTPIGGSAVANAFTGTFDGNDKTISDLSMTGGSRLAIFNYANGATIKNLIVKDLMIEGGSDLAGIVVEAGSGTTITNCHVSGNLTGSSNVVGIAARTNGAFTIKGCSVKVTIAASNGGVMSDAAGITGNSQSGANQTMLIEDCIAEVNLSAAGGNAAGISAYYAANNAEVTIRNCQVIMGEGQSIQAGNYAAGIVGTTSTNTTIENCSVTGGSILAVTPTGISYAGGVVGSMPNNANVKVIDCFVETDVLGESSNVGGLVGALDQYAGNGTLSISGSAFIGNVSGTDNVGGLVGQSKALTVTDCYVSGSVTGSTNVGGILGHKYNNGNLSIDNCLTVASVFGNGNVGGILGSQYSVDTGVITIANSRVLGVAVGTTGMTIASTTGAITGDSPQFNTANFIQSNTYAWTGMMLGRKTLDTTTKADALYNENRNGPGYLGWSLRTAAGWPTSMVNNEGAWSYTAGDFPVLKKFEDKIIYEFPLYMVAIPASGTSGDKTGLQIAIEQAAALKSADYLQESAMFGDVQVRLLFARQVYDLPDASQSAIDEARVSLVNAVTELNRLNALSFDGAGTVDSPYLIPDLDRLLKMNRLVNSTDTATRNNFRVAHYKVTGDIDLAGQKWTPMGGTAAATAFTGSFDGGEKVISNLSLTGTDHLAFFSFAPGATLKNIILKDISVTSSSLNRVAGLVAVADNVNTVIDNCYVSGTIRINGHTAGGIMAYGRGKITNCTAEVDILGGPSSGGSVGGIVGYNWSCTIENSTVRSYTSTGGLVSGGGTGGIVGSMETNAQFPTNIINCSAEINIQVSSGAAGGIIGSGSIGGSTPNTLVISGCYYKGMITSSTATGNKNFGGIAGTISNNYKITDCRSDGTISLATNAGGIISSFAVANGSITNCYTTMRIGNGGVANGLAGGNINANATFINNLALNEQVTGTTTANAIAALADTHDYITSGLRAWDGMLIKEGDATKAAPSGDGAISYAALQTSAGWPAEFKTAPWSYTEGKLPVLTGISGMSDSLPAYLANTEDKTTIADTTALLAIISEANALVEATWMPDTWAKMTSALSVAKALSYKENATQAEIDEAIVNLRDAIDGLELFKIVTTLSGEGSKEKPFLIGSAADYEEMARILEATDFYRAAYYKLTGNIDLGGTVRFSMPYSTATGAISTNQFTGDFDGAGFTISGLSVTGTWGTGMFGYTNGARIHDFTLKDCLISASQNNTGALVGRANNTEFENIWVTGSVMGTSWTGGLVGAANGSIMKNCHLEGLVETQKSSLGYWIGGLAGQFGSYMEDCSFKGQIIYGGTPQTTVTMGGIAGSFGGDMKGCRVEADIIYKHYPGDGVVNNGANVGGIAGEFGGNSIIDCHFKGNIEVRGANNGGIAGVFNGLLIKDCTSDGNLLMNFPGSQQPGRPTGGIFGTVNTDGKEIVIDNVTTWMSLNGFSQAGGIGGTITGNGKLTISNSNAMNKEINNNYSDFNIDPFLYGAGYGGFTGDLILDNNYIWDGMLINGKTLAQWLEDTYNHKGYEDEGNGITIGTRPVNPPTNPPNDGTSPPSNGTNNGPSGNNTTSSQSSVRSNQGTALTPIVNVTPSQENNLITDDTDAVEQPPDEIQQLGDVETPLATRTEESSNPFMLIVVVAIIVIALIAVLYILNARKRNKASE